MWDYILNAPLTCNYIIISAYHVFHFLSGLVPIDLSDDLALMR